MTKNTMIFIFLNMIYLLIWYATNKIRSTKVGKELDSGFEFYNSLNNSLITHNQQVDPIIEIIFTHKSQEN